MEGIAKSPWSIDVDRRRSWHVLPDCNPGSASADSRSRGRWRHLRTRAAELAGRRLSYGHDVLAVSGLGGREGPSVPGENDDQGAMARQHATLQPARNRVGTNAGSGAISWAAIPAHDQRTVVSAVRYD